MNIALIVDILAEGDRFLYHNGGRLRKDKGWSEKDSNNPPDKFWKGEIDNKLPNSLRTYTLRNGSIYVGQYKEGLREGQGTLKPYDGSKFVGILNNFYNLIDRFSVFSTRFIF
jgi:hypothetical protein